MVSQIAIPQKTNLMEEEKNGLIIPDEIVISKILLIRGKKVMIDRDLGELLRRAYQKVE